MIMSVTSLSMLFGVAIGAVLGMTGAGGGVLAVPALMFGLGMTITNAAPIALIAVGLGAFIGSLSGLRRGLVRYRAAILMACFGSACAPVGIWLAHRTSPAVLTIVFCIVMVLIAGRMIGQITHRNVGDNHEVLAVHQCVVDSETGRFKWDLRCGLTLAGIGSIAGLFTGMLGVGGGFIIVPAFRHFSNLSLSASSATSLSVITIVSFSTVAGTLLHGAPISAIGWTFIVTTSAGMLAGRSLSTRLPTHLLQGIFAITVLLVAVSLFFKTIL
jgi:uncharacterized membrane protein YfcA